jgi:hypothetical protein
VKEDGSDFGWAGGRAPEFRAIDQSGRRGMIEMRGEASQIVQNRIRHGEFSYIGQKDFREDIANIGVANIATLIRRMFMPVIHLQNSPSAHTVPGTYRYRTAVPAE